MIIGSAAAYGASQLAKECERRARRRAARDRLLVVSIVWTAGVIFGALMQASDAVFWFKCIVSSSYGYLNGALIALSNRPPRQVDYPEEPNCGGPW